MVEFLRRDLLQGDALEVVQQEDVRRLQGHRPTAAVPPTIVALKRNSHFP